MTEYETESELEAPLSFLHILKCIKDYSIINV